MTDRTISIDESKACTSCGQMGAMPNGLCVECAADQIDSGPAIKLEALSVAMSDLESSWMRKKEAAEDFKVLVDAVAAKSGLESAVVRAYVTARMADRSEKDKRKAEQLQLCFDQLGA